MLTFSCTIYPGSGMPNYRVSLRQFVRKTSDGDLKQNRNSNGPKYSLESNIQDNFISEGIYKESGAHSYSEKKPVYPKDFASGLLQLYRVSATQWLITSPRLHKKTYSGHITSSIRKKKKISYIVQTTKDILSILTFKDIVLIHILHCAISSESIQPLSPSHMAYKTDSAFWYTY